MATVEERVVGMRFDSSKMTSGLKPAVDGLDKLKASLNLDGASKSLDELDAAGKRFTLNGVGDAATAVSGKFIALATIGITALSNIVNKAVDAGQSIVASLTVDPIKAGLDEYELKMGSIQTILANTSKYGTNLQDVNKSLNELNNYADKTIYNFGDMTKNIGLFTNAGLKLEDATSMIKGFSNAAAASGTTAQGAAGAAYQLSQALSAGKITLMDWRSLTNAGMGNKNMQDGLIEIANAMGTFKGKGTDANAVQKDFNGSLEKGWLTAGVMSNYLKIMAGDMDEATQKSLGLSDATISTFMKQQKTAEDAATKVRTYSQLVGTLQEAVGSSWTDTFSIIIGDFDQATELFTNVNNTLSGLIGAAGNARNKILKDWAADGGRAAAIDTISLAFKTLMSILKPIKQAFEEVFPPITGKTLADLTKSLHVFVENLQPGKKALEDIKATAKGFFSLIDIGVQIISGIVGVLFKLFGVVGSGGGSFLEVTGNIGEFITKIDEAIKKGGFLTKFFDGLGNVLKVVLNIIGGVIGAVVALFGGLGDVAGSGFEGWIDRVKDRLAPLGDFISFLGVGLEKLKEVAGAVARFFAPLASLIGGFFANMGNTIKDSFSDGNFNTVLDLLNTGLLAGIGALIYKFVTKFKDTVKELVPGEGITSAIKGVFGELGNTLQTLQGKVKAQTLLIIAGAVALLTASVIGLSLIDTAKLSIALGAIAVMFVQLGAAMAAFDKIFKEKDVVKLIQLSAAMILLSLAVLNLSGAVAILGAIPLPNLVAGVVALAGVMAIMSGAMILLGKAGPMAILGSAALVIASAGILVLAVALKIFSTLSWDDIGRSMVALGGSLAILAIGLTLMMGALPGAAALTVASIGILVIAAALKIFSTLSWDDIGRAMATLGATLAIMAVGLTLMVAALPGAAALVVASVGLAVIAGVLKLFGLLSWEDIGKAMTALGGTLGILAVGLTLMVAALPGAAALVVASVGLTILAGVLAVLGALGWDTIGTGLGAMAAALGILAAAGILLIPAIPGLVGLGVAVAFLGVGVLAAGIGIAALAVGLTALSVAGGAAITVLVAAVSGLAGLIPFVAQQIGLGILAIAATISTGGPQILAALTTILLALIAAIVAVIPPAIDAIVLLVTKLVEALIVLIPLLVDAGLKIVIGILDGIAKNIGKIVEKGTDIVVALLDGIGKAIPRLLQAGVNLILDFVNGLADTIRKNTDKMNAAGNNLAGAIIDGMTSGIRNGVNNVIKAITGIAGGAIDAAKKALGIHSPSKEFREIGKFSVQGWAGGLTEFSKLAENASSDVGQNSVDALKKTMAKAGNEMSLSMDSSPTIRPVLDLSQVRKDAGLIGGIVGSGQTLAVDGATARANEIAAKYGEFQQAQADAATPSTEVNLTQNNYSPKSLPQAEIYRQTNNQMSILKEELNK